MPIITGSTPGTAPLLQATTTATEVVNKAAQEVRNVLDPTNGADQAILIDYVNRIQLQMNRASRWAYLLSDVFYFITQRGQTDYYIGVEGQSEAGEVDTLLNLNDVDYISRNSVFDVTHAVQLQKLDEKPYATSISLRDAQFRPGIPAVWRNDLLRPDVVQLFPVPDNQNDYQPVPASPYVFYTPGGSLANRTYYSVYTFTDNFGNEGTASQREARSDVAAGNVAVFKSPQLPYNIDGTGSSYTGYNVYASSTSTQWKKQNPSPINIGTDWTEATTGLISGATPPTTSALLRMDGYLIGFRYIRQRQILTELGSICQIPDVYKDVLCAGVTWLACQYLRLYQESSQWFQIYQAGIRDMIRDRNAGPRENDFVRPDTASLGIGNYTPYDDTFGEV